MRCQEGKIREGKSELPSALTSGNISFCFAQYLRLIMKYQFICGNYAGKESYVIVSCNSCGLERIGLKLSEREKLLYLMF